MLFHELAEFSPDVLTNKSQDGPLVALIWGVGGLLLGLAKSTTLK